MESAEKRTVEELCPFTPSLLSKSAKKRAKKQLFDEHTDSILDGSAEGPVLAMLIYEMWGTLRKCSLDVKAIRGAIDAFQKKFSNVETEVSAMNASSDFEQTYWHYASR